MAGVWQATNFLFPAEDELGMDEYIGRILDQNWPSEPENRYVDEVFKLLQRRVGWSVAEVEPTAVVVPFGGRASGFAMKGSDLDAQVLILNSEHPEHPNTMPPQLFVTDPDDPPSGEGEGPWRQRTVAFLGKVNRNIWRLKTAQFSLQSFVQTSNLVVRTSFADLGGIVSDLSASCATGVAACVMFRWYAELCPEVGLLGRLVKIWNKRLMEEGVLCAGNDKLPSYAVIVLVLRFLTEFHPVFRYWTPALWKDSTGRVLPAGCFYDAVIGKVQEDDGRSVDRVVEWKKVDLRQAVDKFVNKPWGAIDFTVKPRDRQHLLDEIRGTAEGDRPQISPTRLLLDFFTFIGANRVLPFRDFFDIKEPFKLTEAICVAGRKTAELLKICVDLLPPHPWDNPNGEGEGQGGPSFTDLRRGQAILESIFGANVPCLVYHRQCPTDAQLPAPAEYPTPDPLGEEPPHKVQKMTTGEIQNALDTYTDTPFFPNHADMPLPEHRIPPPRTPGVPTLAADLSNASTETTSSPAPVPPAPSRARGFPPSSPPRRVRVTRGADERDRMREEGERGWVREEDERGRRRDESAWGWGEKRESRHSGKPAPLSAGSSSESESPRPHTQRGTGKARGDGGGGRSESNNASSHSSELYPRSPRRNRERETDRRRDLGEQHRVRNTPPHSLSPPPRGARLRPLPRYRDWERSEQKWVRGNDVSFSEKSHWTTETQIEREREWEEETERTRERERRERQREERDEEEDEERERQRESWKMLKQTRREEAEREAREAFERVQNLEMQRDLLLLDIETEKAKRIAEKRKERADELSRKAEESLVSAPNRAVASASASAAVSERRSPSYRRYARTEMPDGDWEMDWGDSFPS
uniref:Uncharacterized protein n=1 Tax=Chromera velia CCMP2878 TaxID=1169474 RepID=A0A0G4FLA3_9ALVE|eukprot:Cvel_17447.t1-p1 / transcript=Cvel_17447.t1 / gene=Cvel_17447 / organism=Chromera_velia_CCMP2878 / gene_product=hypothetical protein / transcript_product=hypothetical protein / location=Cvel_scaffold1392:22150-29418(+) / protein_length=868 / sequence_SO=supercontig / SO=protein_coding / is_pseudo=false